MMAKTNRKRGRPQVDSASVQVRMLDGELTRVDALEFARFGGLFFRIAEGSKN
jgi:hypothetical protein